MEKFILLIGYAGMPLVFALQPVRLLWQLRLLQRPPSGKCVNRAVLAVASFVRLLSLALAGYFLWRLTGRGVGLTGSLTAAYMVFPFIIFVMGEMVARQIHHCDE